MSSVAPASPGSRQPDQGNDLLLRETNHRCSNDLQLVVSLLALQSRRAADPQVRQALDDAKERVSILARARSAMQSADQPQLTIALRQVCEALHAQAEPRSIMISFEAEHEAPGLSSTQITTLALVVNELTTNAIKHAFDESQEGHIRVLIGNHGDRCVSIIVDDDGLPFSAADGAAYGHGIDLVKRLMVSIGGLLIPPAPGTKLFELRLPLPSY